MVKDSAEIIQMNKLSNRLIQIAGESNVFAFNARKFKNELSDQMSILFAASVAIAVILFIMTFFQITVSVQSCMREDSQELGILR